MSRCGHVEEDVNDRGYGETLTNRMEKEVVGGCFSYWLVWADGLE